MKDLINSLGEPVDKNEYIIKPINGQWWIEHKHVGSGEPLIQWLNTELRQPVVKVKNNDVIDINQTEINFES